MFFLAGIMLDSECRIQNEYDKFYPQFNLDEKKYEKNKSKEKKRQTIVKLLVHDSNKSDKSDEIHDESTE